MSSQIAITAAETPAANGHGEAHSTAGFKALMLGCIGVVYGDIGTSPLYALREAIVAASGSTGSADPQAVLGILSLILWALVVVVTLKYVVILLRADNNGEGGTLALMALAQRGVSNSKGAAAIVLLGIISGALFYGDAVITPALSVLSAIEGIKLVTVDIRPLRRAAHGDHSDRAVRGSVARHRARRHVLRAGDVRLVRGHRGRGRAADHAVIPKCCWRSIRSMRFPS